MLRLCRLVPCEGRGTVTWSAVDQHKKRGRKNVLMVRGQLSWHAVLKTESGSLPVCTHSLHTVQLSQFSVVPACAPESYCSGVWVYKLSKIPSLRTTNECLK